MRDLAIDPKQAYKHLGVQNGQAFIGLLADFRAGIFAGDVPSGPISTRLSGQHFYLDWFVSAVCTLNTKVLVSDGNAADSWKESYRIRLESVTLGKEILA